MVFTHTILHPYIWNIHTTVHAWPFIHIHTSLDTGLVVHIISCSPFVHHIQIHDSLRKKKT